MGKWISKDCYVENLEEHERNQGKQTRYFKGCNYKETSLAEAWADILGKKPKDIGKTKKFRRILKTRL